MTETERLEAVVKQQGVEINRLADENFGQRAVITQLRKGALPPEEEFRECAAIAERYRQTAVAAQKSEREARELLEKEQARLDWLEDELEQEELQRQSRLRMPWPQSLFRRNLLITRETIDKAMEEAAQFRCICGTFEQDHRECPVHKKLAK